MGQKASLSGQAPVAQQAMVPADLSSNPAVLKAGQGTRLLQRASAGSLAVVLRATEPAGDFKMPVPAVECVCPSCSSISPVMEIPQPPREFIPVFHHPDRTFFLMCNLNLPCCNLSPLLLVCRGRKVMVRLCPIAPALCHWRVGPCTVSVLQPVSL